MENKEQMMHVARNCYDYESMGKRISSCTSRILCNSCLNCKHCENSTCVKDLFDNTLISLD